MLRVFPNLARRELVGEVMDDPLLAESEHLPALRGLRRINTVSRTAPTLMRQLLRLMGDDPGRPRRVLDIACGDGDNTTRLARLAARRRLAWRIDGCDLSERSVGLARALADRRGVASSFFQADALSGLELAGYDAVVNSLFLHHLEDDQITGLFNQLCRVEHGVISDLIRSRSAYLATCLGVRLLSASRVVHQDGPLSVRAALTVDEMRRAVAGSGLSGARVCRAWPMRQLIRWGPSA